MIHLSWCREMSELNLPWSSVKVINSWRSFRLIMERITLNRPTDAGLIKIALSPPSHRTYSQARRQKRIRLGQRSTNLPILFPEQEINAPKPILPPPSASPASQNASKQAGKRLAKRIEMATMFKRDYDDLIESRVYAQARRVATDMSAKVCFLSSKAGWFSD